MSCQFTWNYNDYKFNLRKTENTIIGRATSPVNLSGIENNTLEELRGILVIESNDTYKDETKKNVKIQQNYNIVVSNGNNTIGSLYVVIYWEQLKLEPLTYKKNISGTVSCKGIFSKFDNGTAIYEYNNDTGKRCITLYEKN